MRTIKDFFKNDRFAALAGVELLEVSEGFARARMLVGPQHLNGAGVCQGGAIFTLADLAFAAAVNSHLQITVSVSTNITYVSAAYEGYLYAEAREKVNHRRLPFAEVIVTDADNQTIAIITSTGYRKKDIISLE